jgi:DtxR family Mn-dependent transcriptional regulator
MLKALHESGLAEYAPYDGVRLTESGRNLALKVLRRQRLIELFLSTTLGMSWDEVHEEAEHMEHTVSDRLINRIDQFLGFPETEPHGDPIPKADGALPATASSSLAECGAGSRFCLARVLDQSPEFLRFLSASRMMLGMEGQVLANHPEGGILRLRVDDEEIMVSHETARKLMVHLLGAK